ncbi:hypothetical protein [Ralstonia chuxiongensis]|uniref:hypothetical protein n=1 Tax=Ralstonia chuxiongensis TaxID=2957504 RepID=UPI0028F56D19|nr:hypothetical protein [Ralstonia chuxiongensis]CAJ0785122.1 hypothetical protein R8510_05344 [Ralstonia chuxiongensis]
MSTECEPANGAIKPLLGPSNGDYKEKWSHIRQHIEIRRTNDYCVGIDEKLKIDWGTSEEYDQRELAKEDAQRKRCSAILADIAVEEACPRDDLDKDVVIRYKTLLGEAYVLCFEGEFDGAQRTLERAKKYMALRSEERSREWYVEASAVATLPFLAIFAALWCARDATAAFFGVNAFWLLLSGCGGAIGALFSVIARSGKLEFDVGAGKRLHYVEGSSRIVAGAISGLVVGMTVRSDLVFGAFARDHLSLVTILAAIAAGTGERLATSIISKFDEKTESTKSEE